MDDRDYPSDSDQSDEDFQPENESNEEDLSEEEKHEESSDNNEDADETENSMQKTGRKRGKKSSMSFKGKFGIAQKKSKLSPKNKEEETSEKSEVVAEIKEEAEKKRSDELWASFLSDVSSESGKKAEKSAEALNTDVNKASNLKEANNDFTGKNLGLSSSSSLEAEKTKIQITETYEFAGEEVKITKEIPIDQSNKQQIQTKKSNPRFSKGLPPTLKRSGGLSSVLNSINQKGKLSVLEKTKHDWDSFKKNEGLSEELQNFNRGKDGYLERQDFLERTDLRQFEIEKNLRQTKKSTR